MHASGSWNAGDPVGAGRKPPVGVAARIRYVSFIGTPLFCAANSRNSASNGTSPTISAKGLVPGSSPAMATAWSVPAGSVNETSLPARAFPSNGAAGCGFCPHGVASSLSSRPILLSLWSVIIGRRRINFLATLLLAVHLDSQLFQQPGESVSLRFPIQFSTSVKSLVNLHSAGPHVYSLRQPTAFWPASPLRAFSPLPELLSNQPLMPQVIRPT